MHRLFRTVARIAALTVVIVGGSAVAAISPAMADIGADIGLVCSGKSGTHKVRLRIETTVPSSATVGEPIQLGTVKVDVGIPADLVKKIQPGSSGEPLTQPVTGVTPSSAAPPALSGVAEMQVGVHEPDRVQDGGWPAFALAAAPSGGDGVVHLTGSGVAPPMTPQSPGGVSWTASELNLSLLPADPTGGQDMAEVAVHCAAEKDTLLGTVRVRREKEAATPAVLSAPPSQPIASQANLCEILPARGEDPRYAVNLVDPELRKLYDFPPEPTSGVSKVQDAGKPFCIKGAGFINAKKVGNAVPLAVEASTRFITDNWAGSPILPPNYREQRGYGVTRSYRIPATVLGFGFMPTRAVAEAVQVGPPGSGKDSPITANIRLIQKQFANYTMPGIGPDQLGVSSYIRVKAANAQVNGVELDLGDQCMTSPTPFVAKSFLGSWRTGIVRPTDGETLVVNELKIPSFSGCGVTEDLSPILTASVSGAGNYAKAETAVWCNAGDGTNCVDGAGPPPPTFTITPGGDTTATAHPSFVLTRATSPEQAEFKCKSAAMQFKFNRGHWQSHFMTARGDMSLEDCKIKASDGAEYPVVEVTQEGSLWLAIDLFRTDPMQLSVTGLMLNAGVDVNGDGAADCRIHINSPRQYNIANRTLSGTPGYIKGAYSNGAMPMQYNDLGVSPESTCNIPGFALANSQELALFSGASETRFVFSPVQTIIWDSRY